MSEIPEFLCTKNERFFKTVPACNRGLSLQAGLMKLAGISGTPHNSTTSWTEAEKKLSPLIHLTGMAVLAQQRC